ncbi:MAG: hypothetical protein NVS1B11_11500 [Terriglobales bacterium]
MTPENGKEFCDTIAQFFANSSVCRFGFEKEEKAVARKLSDLIVPLDRGRELLNRRSVGEGDSFGLMLSQLSVFDGSSFRYGFVLGAKENSPVGLTSHYVIAIRSLDSIAEQTEKFGW